MLSQPPLEVVRVPDIVGTISTAQQVEPEGHGVAWDTALDCQAERMMPRLYRAAREWLTLGLSVHIVVHHEETGTAQGALPRRSERA